MAAAAALAHTHLNVYRLPKKSRCQAVSESIPSYKSQANHGSTSSATQKQQRKPIPKIKRKVIHGNDFLATRSLVSFVESGSLDNAFQMFEKMSHSDTFVWNVVIRGLVYNGYYQEAMDFYHRMFKAGVRPDNFTYPFVIKACAGVRSLVDVQIVHSRLVKAGLVVDVYVSNALISSYAKLGCIEFAEILFEALEFRDLVSWNSMISGYVLARDGLSSLMHLMDMQSFGMVPDRFSLLSALGACTIGCLLMKGKEVHCQVMRSGFEMDVKIQTSLIDMYSKCGRVDYAETFFNSMPQRTLGAWNAMIGGYAFNGSPSESFTCLDNMHGVCGLVDDTITLISILPACAELGELSHGKSVHGFAIRKGFLPHLVLETALVNMYGECGRVNVAELIFTQMIEKSLVSWNAMLAGYVQSEKYREALDLFRDLWKSGLEPDDATIASILPSYAEEGTLREGKQVHGYIVKLGAHSNTYILNALVYMYAKCGDLADSRKLFDRIVYKDIVSWNTIIMSHALHGFGEDSLAYFSRMRAEGIKPNGSTFVSLLSSCSNAGMVKEGWKYFNLMEEEYGIDPGIEHYGCMLDLLGRKGDLDMAQWLVDEMPLAPTARIWGSLLTAARNSKDIALAERVSEHIFQLQRDNTGCYVLLSNMYAEQGRWEDAERIKRNMKQQGVEKTAGCSTVDVNGKIHQFLHHDKSHKETNRIYDTLDMISRKVEVGSPTQTITKFKPRELSKERAKSPKLHCVRLAVCFGLISYSVGKPVLVRKNVRICEECHEAVKKVSEITKREIVVGDSKMFHHFENGRCSCRDYW